MRQRLAEALHDDVAQTLTGIKLRLTRLGMDDLGDRREACEETLRLIDRANRAVRQLMRGLDPPESPPADLSAALRQIAEEADRKSTRLNSSHYS